MTILAIAALVEALLLVAQAVERVVADRASARERARLVNAAIARHSGDFAVLQRAVDGDPDVHPSAEPGRPPLVGLE